MKVKLPELRRANSDGGPSALRDWPIVESWAATGAATLSPSRIARRAMRDFDIRASGWEDARCRHRAELADRRARAPGGTFSLGELSRWQADAYAVAGVAE